MKIWLLWRKENKNGRVTKIPFAASGGATGTSENYRNTWVTYADAVKAAEIKGASGVGFVIPEGYFFLDTDGYKLDDPYVQALIKRFDSYAERSVSGNGQHIYGKCNLDKLPVYEENGKKKLYKAYYMKNPNNSTELYFGGITNRFAVFTGDVISNKPLADCTDAVIETLNKYMKRNNVTSETETTADAVDALDVVAALRKQKNGAKFSKLYDDGDYSDFGSHSEADASLCSMIAFCTGPNPSAIDAIFRGSALYREKWERTDYRESTIQLGINACNGKFYTSKRVAPAFIKFNSETGKASVSVPLLAKHIRENLQYLLVRDNGKQGLLKYVYENGCYRLYAEFKGQQGFEYTYNGLLWFCMNKLPKFGGDDGQWVYDRIMVVECPNIIPKNKQDKMLLEKMYAERDGIVFKAIKALQRVIANGYRFTEPESVARAREKYMAENNTVISFYEECMCERPNGKICDAATTGRIYDVYRAWCQNNNNGFAKTAKEFRETLAKHLGTTFKEMSTHTNKGTFYKDLTITIDTKEQYKKVYGYDSTDYLA